MKKPILMFFTLLIFSVSSAQQNDVFAGISRSYEATIGNYGFYKDSVLNIDSRSSLLFPLGNTYFTVEDTTAINNKMYKIWLTFNNEPIKLKGIGILYQSKESSILITPFINKRQLISDEYLVEFPIKNIETIKLRKNKKIGKGILIGAITGLAVGGLIGLISGDDPPDDWFGLTAGEKAIFAGVPLAASGAGIGAILGSIKMKIPINGSSDKYQKNIAKLREYSIKK